MRMRRNTMSKEELFKEYAAKYQDYLYGKCCYEDVFKILEKINSNAHKEANSIDNRKDIVHSNTSRANSIEKEVKEEYEKNIVAPLSEELLDFLQFEGLVKSTQWMKRAEELKEKLQKYDGIFMVRKRALREFYRTKIGSRYDERMKTELALKLGALDTKNL